jgi:hypothetical protein
MSEYCTPDSSVDNVVLFSLPRELRDDIYSHLVLPEHVYFSNSKHISTFKATKDDTYIDTRIYLPIRPPCNMLGTCRQLREEMLDFAAHLIESSRTAQNTQVYQHIQRRAEDSNMDESNEDLEQSEERARDGGCLRLTLVYTAYILELRHVLMRSCLQEIMRYIRGNAWAYIPDRITPSPLFFSMLPLLNRLRRIKFTVWASWLWWKADEPPRTHVSKFKSGTRFKRTSSDETDELRDQPASRDVVDGSAQYVPPKPDPLSVAMGAVLEKLPNIEEIDVDVLMLPSEWASWDLPDNKWEGVQGWLDDYSLLTIGRAHKSLYKRLIICSPTVKAKAAILYHRLAKYDAVGQEGEGVTMHISEGEGTAENFQYASEQPTFKRTYSIAQPVEKRSGS